MPYLLEKSRFGIIFFFVKRNTLLLLFKYKVFIFLQDHLHFFLHFFFTFMEQLFLDDPISKVQKRERRKKWWILDGIGAVSRLLFALSEGSTVFQVSFMWHREQVLIIADTFWNICFVSGAPLAIAMKLHCFRIKI